MRVLIIFIVFGLLVGCQSTPHSAPILEADPIPKKRILEHTVAPGETLYSIALKYDLDYEKLSRINRLDDEYAIHPGQVLRLDVETFEVAAPTPVSTAVETSGLPSSRLVNKTPMVSAKGAPNRSSDSIQWYWPLSGKVLEVYSGRDGLNKGIDIRGNLGEPVLAAADGEVVYSGSGLRGYGNLIIVKHNERFLSAYAHNRVILVREGDRVRAGQRIAEVGFSGSNVAKLHFEIRLNGKPEDPLRYLPRR